MSLHASVWMLRFQLEAKVWIKQGSISSTVIFAVVVDVVTELVRKAVM